jgi:hypothetical protein
MKKGIKLTVLIMLLCVIHTEQTFANDHYGNTDGAKEEVDECTVKGLFYTVQLGVFSNPIAEEAFQEIVKPVYCIKRDDGLYAYFVGIYDSRFDAMRKRYLVAKAGHYDTYVAVYYNGEQISIGEADELIAQHGDEILYNADKGDLYTEKAK